MRPARRDDVAAIVRLLADDALGATREDPSDPLPSGYGAAFAQIDANPDHHLLVAERQGVVAGTIHLTIMPSLTYQGRPRGQLEAMRVHRDARRDGIGAALVRHAVREAQRRGCTVIQLTTDKRRPEAHAFWEELGFRATHEGMKRFLEDS